MEHHEDLTPESFQGLFTVDLREDLVKILRDSEQSFRVLVDLLPICLMVHRAGKIVYANPGLVRLLGYEKAEELIGKPPLGLVPPEDREKIQKRINRLSEPGNHGNPAVEQVMVKKNGEKIFAEAESIAVIHQGVPAVMVILRDATQRQKTEEALRSSEEALRSSNENFKAMMERMPDGILIGDLQKVLFVNGQMLRILGYERKEELVGHDVLSFIHPDYRDFARERAWLAYGKEVINPLMEYQYLAKNGQPVDIEASSISIQFEGKPAVLAALRDITPRKKIEKALLKSEKSFKAMIDQMPDGIVIERPDRILFANPSLVRLLGYEKEDELIGRPPLSMIPSEFQEIIRKRITEIDAHGGVNALLKYPVIRKDGSLVEVEVSSFSTVYGGEPVIVAVVRDMTQQNHMERQAALNERLATVGTLAAGVAHEINNPLTYVLANLVFSKEHVDELRAQVEARGLMDDQSRKLFSELRSEMADTLQGGERIRDIVRGLKSFTRVNDDDVEKMDLNKTIEGAINLCYHEVKRKARLEKDYGLDLPVLEANTGKLQQVFINLLINAAQAIEGNRPEENKIHIRTGQDTEGLFAEFTDTGKGIPEKVLPRIFEPFFTTKPVGVGTGLGLYICDDIIRHYHGRMEVQSQEGKGTTFTVRLPASRGRAENAPAPATASSPDLPGGRVLLVDDDPSNLEVLKRIFKKTHEVLTALTGVDAMAILEREGGRMDAIVTDINMPDMNGVEFYQAVAGKFPGVEKRVVFITGGIFDQAVTDFLKTIPNPCLEKPFSFEALLGAVFPPRRG